MALPILRMGNPILRQKSDPFNLENEMNSVHEILNLMHATLKEINSAIGLAAPQIGILKRLVIFEIPEAHPRYKVDSLPIPLTIMINPSYQPLTLEKNYEWEACLSIPEMMGYVPRYTHITYQYFDLEGNQYQKEAHHFHARAIQHEVDHLDGILYPYLIDSMDHFGFKEEILQCK